MGALEDSFEIKLPLDLMAVVESEQALEDVVCSDPLDESVQELFAGYDEERRRSGVSVAIALMRLSFPDTSSAVARKVAGRRVGDRLRTFVTEREFVQLPMEDEFVVVLGGVGVDAARDRVQEYVDRIIQDPAVKIVQMKLVAGMAMAGSGECMEAFRTAQLACELAGYQASGYVELIDL